MTGSSAAVSARAAGVLLLVSVLWAAALVAAPEAASTASASTASVSPALFASVAVYGAGGLVCHQHDDRSFHTAGLRWPVCARCAGLYISGGLAALVFLLAPGSWTPRVRAHVPLTFVLLVAAMPTAASWGAEHLGLVAPGNALRAVLAAPLGIAVMSLVGQVWRTGGRAGQLR